MNFIDNLKDFFMPADDNEPETPSMTPPEPEPGSAAEPRCTDLWLQQF